MGGVFGHLGIRPPSEAHVSGIVSLLPVPGVPLSLVCPGLCPCSALSWTYLNFEICSDMLSVYARDPARPPRQCRIESFGTAGGALVVALYC